MSEEGISADRLDLVLSSVQDERIARINKNSMSSGCQSLLPQQSPMSQEFHVFVFDARIPSRDEWQQAIEQMEFPFELHPEFDVRTDTGFVPSTYNDGSTGFEFYLDPTEALINDDTDIKKLGGRDQCLGFRVGSDLYECAAAMCAAAALVQLSDGMYYDSDNDTYLGADEAVKLLRAELESIEAERPTEE